MTDSSTPIQDAPDVTKDERKAIDAVRTWGDLLVVREQVKQTEKPKPE